MRMYTCTHVRRREASGFSPLFLPKRCVLRIRFRTNNSMSRKRERQQRAQPQASKQNTQEAFSTSSHISATQLVRQHCKKKKKTRNCETQCHHKMERSTKAQGGGKGELRSRAEGKEGGNNSDAVQCRQSAARQQQGDVSFKRLSSTTTNNAIVKVQP